MANKTNDTVTRLYKVNNNANVTHLKAQVYYALGGANMFTYKNEPRGYWMQIVPVKRENKYGYTMESFTAFTGLKALVLPVQRKSKKKFDEAIAYFEEHIEEFIKNNFSEFEVNLEEWEVK